MVKKIYHTMIYAQIFTSLTLIISLWADSIIIGQYCKGNSLAAYGYVMPLLLLANAIGQTLSQGNQINCSRLIGIGKHEETNRYFTTGCLSTFVIGLFLSCIVLLFHSKISIFLGTAMYSDVYDKANDYLLGLTPGIPFMLFVLGLTPFLQIAGEQKRLIIGVASMIITDISLNFVAVYFFESQMLGIGLASSASYFVCLFIFGTFFISPKCNFHFKIKLYSFHALFKIIYEGFPTLINVTCSVLSTYAINRLLKYYSGDHAVAAYSIITNVMNFCYSFSSGVATVTLTATALFHSEQDKISLYNVFRTMLQISMGIAICIAFLVSALANGISGLFISNEPEVFQLTVSGMRILAISFFFSAFTAGIKAFYQGMGYLIYLKAIMIFQNFLGTLIASSILGYLFGVNGVWYGFLFCEIFTLFIIYIVSVVKNKNLSLSVVNLTLLPSTYGATNNSFILSLQNKEELHEATASISTFCESQEMNEDCISHILQYVTLIVTQCYESAECKMKPEMNIRILNYDDKIRIRFRDNHTKWNHFLEDVISSEQYSYSTILGLNNVTVDIKK